MRLLDTKEAAKRLGLTERGLRFVCKKGKLGTQVSGCWVFTESELKVYKPIPRGWPKGKRRKRKK